MAIEPTKGPLCFSFGMLLWDLPNNPPVGVGPVGVGPIFPGHREHRRATGSSSHENLAGEELVKKRHQALDEWTWCNPGKGMWRLTMERWLWHSSYISSLVCQIKRPFFTLLHFSICDTFLPLDSGVSLAKVLGENSSTSRVPLWFIFYFLGFSSKFKYKSASRIIDNDLPWESPLDALQNGTFQNITFQRFRPGPTLTHSGWRQSACKAKRRKHWMRCAQRRELQTL